MSAMQNPSQPRKFKIVISDLHLGKGRLLKDGSLNLYEEFYYGDKLVEFIQFYSTGPYREDEVELIINGDFLNFLQVDYKGHFLNIVTESIAVEMLKSIISGHQNVFEALAEFASKPNKSITYIIGNHDQPMLWPACKVLMNSVIGQPVRFKNLVYSFDGVHIEHGHMQEAANRIDPKKFFLKRDLAEPVLNYPFGSHFFIEMVLKIKHRQPHIDKVRPFSKMVRWFVLNEFKFSLQTFFQLSWYFLKSMFVKNPRLNWSMSKILKIVLESAVFPDLSGAATRILTDDKIHTVIFGHNHVYTYRQLGNGKEYFNTGTWTELTSLDIVSLGKITKLTYVVLEYTPDNRVPRGRLKEWKGFHRIEEDIAIS